MDMIVIRRLNRIIASALPLLPLLLLLCSDLQAADLDCSKPGLTIGTYKAASGTRLEACFDLNAHKVTVRLPDATTVNLPAAVSASGSRYSDGSRTFWEHQGVGRYFKGEELVFEGKLTDRTGLD